MTAFGDAVGVAKAWSLAVPGLTGPGAPISNGLHRSHRDGGAGKGTYGILTRIDGGLFDTGTHEQARLSAEFYGPNMEAAERAAVAYLNALLGIPAHPNPDPADTPAGSLSMAGNISGPVYLPDQGRARYVVDADFVIAYAA